MNNARPVLHHPIETGRDLSGEAPRRLESLLHAIEHAAHLLPSQGPITVFVHHNTLHPFEDLPFEEGLRAGFEVLGCEPYLPEDRYRECLVTGRIRQDELAMVLSEDLGESAEVLLGLLGTRFKLRMAMLEHPLQLAPTAELRWLVEETDALRRFRNFVHGPTRLRMVAETCHWVMRDVRNGMGSPIGGPAPEQTVRIKQHVSELFTLFGKSTVERWSDETWESFCLHLLWRICLDGSQSVEDRTARRRELPVRHADLLRLATNEDSDLMVNEVLIRFCAAFLDQGYAPWRLPERDQSFFRAFAELYGRSFRPPDRWMRGLRSELKRLEEARTSPLESIDESLCILGVSDEQREAYVVASLRALPGWGGMIWQMETNAEWTLFPAPAGSLTEFLAIRLILDRLAVAHVARESLGWGGELRDLCQELQQRIPDTHTSGIERNAFLAFQLAQIRGWLPQELYDLSRQQWQLLVNELETFSSFERRRIFQRAYERRYRNRTLDAIELHCKTRQPWAHESASSREAAPGFAAPNRILIDSDHSASPATHSKLTPSFQIVCCIDDREESFRRHLEEVDPLCETFGAAGFFGVAMYYCGASEAHPRPLCPVVIKPRHYVNEEVALAFAREHKRRAETRRVLGSASHQFHLGSRTFFGGFLTAIGGTLASIPMVARVLFPRTTAQIRRLFGDFLRQPAVTQLSLERTEQEPGPEEGHVGYSLEEMATIVERLLWDIGLTKHFAQLVIMSGHGSSSLNNPHESAYNCGACSGGRGGPNARAFAEMANDVRVREMLSQRGLQVPVETIFVSAMHNTCDDSMTFFDLDRLSSIQGKRFEQVCDTIDEARRRNALERCRRFESAPLTLSFEGALKHVESRAEDLSQARPEYNHATDALVLVGHRWWSRNLFLDRRAFLQSYDPKLDDAEHNILARILAAVIPVCAGIGLEYYFSCVDTEMLGCGSKLPHNITSLLGVMEGAASDLRPGLSQQMIEIHEPMRILFVMESTPEAMLSIMDRNPVVGRLCRNEWVQLAVLDTESSKLQVYREGEFKPYRMRSDVMPTVASSADWFRGWRDHLGCAVIEEPQPS